QLSFIRRLQTLRPTIVHLNPSLNFPSFARDTLFAITAKLHGAKLLVFFRGWDEAFAQTLDKGWRWLYRIGLGRADHIIALSSDIAMQLQRWSSKQQIDIDRTVVPNDLIVGFDLDQKLTDVANDQTLRVLLMARLEPEKGVRETIEAVVRLASAGQKIHLTIAGAGSFQQELEDQLSRHPEVAEHVSFVGYVRNEEKKALLLRSHVYCLPTYHGEGLPNALVEALAFGLPVITCAAGGIKDLFADGSMGYLVEPKKPEAIEQRLLELLTDRELARKIGSFNHNFAKEQLLASSAANRLAAAYASLAAE
ncbi:MAG: glycosyltransferase family 4 protein, partial [Pseudomonadota bacterium]